ncbi:hypothetical protein D7319_03450 [Streptomyces radicis]|uniref:Uncharacterized protein n=1 Tax=Streptomyces radicis TaxID=1750517 RepID=A0A3A9WG95_9ACTN|nr:hypothetical protein D7319_03450 [Streptomyces radicis]RKN25973.1 hypothetical protein D7318_07030 [Streptomyces radicis]
MWTAPRSTPTESRHRTGRRHDATRWARSCGPSRPPRIALSRTFPPSGSALPPSGSALPPSGSALPAPGYRSPIPRDSAFPAHPLHPTHPHPTHASRRPRTTAVKSTNRISRAV